MVGWKYMVLLQQGKVVANPRAAERERRRIFKNVLTDDETSAHNIKSRVMELISSGDAKKVMAGFDLLQAYKSNKELDGQNSGIKLELLKMHIGQTSTRMEDDCAISAGIDMLSGDIPALSTILSRSYIDFWVGDFQHTGLTNAGKLAMHAISGRVVEVQDETALLFIAIHSSDEADRLAAVEGLDDPESLRNVAIHSKHPTNLRALEKLSKDEDSVVEVAIGLPRVNEITPVAQAALDMLRDKKEALEEVATYAEGRQGEIAALGFKDDPAALIRIALSTPWQGQAISPVAGHADRRRFAWDLLVKTGGAREWAFVVKEALKEEFPSLSQDSSTPQSEALRKLGSTVSKIADRAILKLVARNTDDDTVRGVANQKLSETSLLGKLRQLVVHTE